MKKTMYKKIWDSQLVVEETGKAPLPYIDYHLMLEVIMAHCVPTKDRNKLIVDTTANKLIENLACNCRKKHHNQSFQRLWSYS